MTSVCPSLYHTAGQSSRTLSIINSTILANQAAYNQRPSGLLMIYGPGKNKRTDMDTQLWQTTNEDNTL